MVALTRGVVGPGLNMLRLTGRLNGISRTYGAVKCDQSDFCHCGGLCRANNSRTLRRLDHGGPGRGGQIPRCVRRTVVTLTVRGPTLKRFETSGRLGGGKMVISSDKIHSI